MENDYLFYNKACKSICELVNQSFSPEMVRIMEEKNLSFESWEVGIFYTKYFIEYLKEFSDSKLNQRDIIEMISTVFVINEEYWNTIINPNKELYLSFRDGFLFAVDLDVILNDQFGIEVLSN